MFQRQWHAAGGRCMPLSSGSGSGSDLQPTNPTFATRWSPFTQRNPCALPLHRRAASSSPMQSCKLCQVLRKLAVVKTMNKLGACPKKMLGTLSRTLVDVTVQLGGRQNKTSKVAKPTCRTRSATLSLVLAPFSAYFGGLLGRS